MTCARANVRARVHVRGEGGRGMLDRCLVGNNYYSHSALHCQLENCCALKAERESEWNEVSTRDPVIVVWLLAGMFSGGHHSTASVRMDCADEVIRASII